MQRIVRTDVLFATLNSSARKVNSELNRACPPHLANMFATLREGSDGHMEWWTPLGGQAIALADLEAEQKAQFLTLLEQRKQSLLAFAEHLDGEQDHESANAIRWIMRDTDFTKVYSVDNQPVIVGWHRYIVEKPAAAPKIPVAAIAPAATTAALKKRRLWPWLILLLLLLAAALLAGWWWQSKAPLFSNEAVASADNSSGLTRYACSAKENQAVPDFVTVFDTSGSMNLNINATAADEEWWFGRQVESEIDFARQTRIFSAPTREDVAKQAYGQMLSNLHPDIDTRLVTFNGCAALVDHGVFTAKQRPELMATLNNTPADQGTPLAASLRHAAARVDGVDKEAIIILFIDGEDGCGENVCALSRQIAQQQPRLKINVVDVSGNGLSSCAAELTGGRIYSSQDIAQIDDFFVQAAAELANSSCE